MKSVSSSVATFVLPIAGAIALAGCAAVAPSGPVGAPAAPASAPSSPPGLSPAMQWLYGSGEGAAASLQAYGAVRSHVLAAVRDRPARSAVLSAGSTLEAPRFDECGARPLAVILDIDETAIQNLGYEYHLALHGPDEGGRALRRWHQTGADFVAPMPGAVDALNAIRAAGVTVFFVSNRNSDSAVQTARALDVAGIGPAVAGETLLLRGDVAPGSGKDPRRAAVAALHCVVAVVGDQLGDFFDRFNDRGVSVRDRRRAVASAPFADLWGDGWFMLSNPVYGPGLRGDIDEIFPADTRWTDPEGEN